MDPQPPARKKTQVSRRTAPGSAAPRPGRIEPRFDVDPGSATPDRPVAAKPEPSRFEPPLSAIGPMFRARLQRLHLCRVPYTLDINDRATNRVLGGYYKSRRLVRIYAEDTEQGRRPLDELFDTFLHEIAHHLEYTEPQSFSGKACQRVPGRMHSRLFWKILSDLKNRWARLQESGIRRNTQARS